MSNVENKAYISSGHSDKCIGAVGVLDERTEAIKVSQRVYDILGAEHAYIFHDRTSQTQATNLKTINAKHNAKPCKINLSVHFNSGVATATGVECLYFDNGKDTITKTLSSKMSKAVADSLGLRNRGAKKRNDLSVLRNIRQKAILLEVCFVSNKGDAEAYRKNFESMCQAIAQVLRDYLGLKGSQKPSKPSQSVSKPTADKSTSVDTYTVKKGDTLFSIARNNKVNLPDLRTWNGIVGDFIKVGQKLYLKDTATPKGNSAKYYGTSVIGKKVKAKVNVSLYNSTTFNDATKKLEYKKGTVFTISGVAKTSGGTNRLLTKSGYYLTANKEYVETV